MRQIFMQETPRISLRISHCFLHINFTNFALFFHMNFMDFALFFAYEFHAFPTIDGGEQTQKDGLIRNNFIVHFKTFCEILHSFLYMFYKRLATELSARRLIYSIKRPIRLSEEAVSNFLDRSVFAALKPFAGVGRKPTKPVSFAKNMCKPNSFFRFGL